MGILNCMPFALTSVGSYRTSVEMTQWKMFYASFQDR